MRTVLGGRLTRADKDSGPTRLELTETGGALLITPRGSVDARAVEFSAGLAADPVHVPVVLDLPARAPVETWKAAARLLRRQGPSFRVVLARHEGADALVAPQLLADLLRCEVLAADGPLRPAAGGWLWLPEGHGSGWLSFRPGVVARRVSRRFPEPAWEAGLRDRTWRPVDGVVAEPLPAGVWLRPSDDEAPDGHRVRLTAELAGRTDRLTVALGAPGGTPLPATAVADWWAALPAATRHVVRFVGYGPVTVPGGDLGRGLADLLGGPVTVCTGLPEATGQGSGARMHTVLADGSRGWRPFAQEVEYAPRASDGGPAVSPRVVAHRRPLPGLSEITEEVYRQTYRYASGAVLEVVRSGLWLRPARDPLGADRVRHAPVAPAHAVIWYDSGSAGGSEDLRDLAWELRKRLGPALGPHCRVLPSPDGNATAARRDAAPAVRTVPREDSAELAEPVAREDSAEPVARRGPDGAEEETDRADPHDLSAVRRWLYENGRSGPTSPPHDSLARHVTSELRRLPSYEGVAIVRVTGPRPAVADYRTHRLVTERGLWPASTRLDERPRRRSPGGGEGVAEFLIWSVTARPTYELDPVFADRVVFLPGTTFRVLHVTGGPYATVLMREVPASEAVSEDRGMTAQLDTAALTALTPAVSVAEPENPARSTA